MKITIFQNEKIFSENNDIILHFSNLFTVFNVSLIIEDSQIQICFCIQ